MQVLSVEHDPLKLFGQATEFVFVLGVLDAPQTKVKGLLGSVEGGRGGSRFYLVATLLAFRPTCLHRFACACTSLLRSERGSSGGAALLAAFPPKRNGGWILFLYGQWHICIIRDRSGIRQLLTARVFYRSSARSFLRPSFG